MPTRNQEKQIRDVMTLRQLAMSAILAESARDMSIVTATEALSKLRRDKYAVATAEGVTEKIYQNYVKDLNRGGTTCIERVITDVGGGKVQVTTARKFVPWLNDMTKRESSEIITLLADAERDGVYPASVARDLKKYFQNTNHNAMTAARTESAKIRNDARSQSFADSGVKYVEYVTAGDELVRPEHAMRNGKIYRHDDAPWIGEYNCRCLLVPADYKVEEKGASVTPSDAEVLDKAALTAGQTAQATASPMDAARGQIGVDEAAERAVFTPAATIKEAEGFLKKYDIDVNYEGISIDAANALNEAISSNLAIAPKIIGSLKNSTTIKQARSKIAAASKVYKERAFNETLKLNPHIAQITDPNEKKEIYTYIRRRVARNDPTKIYLKGGRGDYGTLGRPVVAYFDPLYDPQIDLDLRGVYINEKLFSPENYSKELEDLVKQVEKRFHPVGCVTPKSVIDHECGHLIDDAYKIKNDREILSIFNKWDALGERQGIDALCGYAWDPGAPSKRLGEFIAEAWSEYLNNPEPREIAQQVGDRMMEIIKNA